MTQATSIATIVTPASSSGFDSAGSRLSLEEPAPRTGDVLDHGLLRLRPVAATDRIQDALVLGDHAPRTLDRVVEAQITREIHAEADLAPQHTEGRHEEVVAGGQRHGTVKLDVGIDAGQSVAQPLLQGVEGGPDGAETPHIVALGRE